MKCPRCQNEDPKYFYTFNDRTYCRRCVSIGNDNYVLAPQENHLHVDYLLDYTLTPLQQTTANYLLQRYQEGKNTLLKAVCGAGKTEITYEVIKYALNQQQTVCFATPRKELVIELASRFEQQFTGIKPTLVYGGHSDEVAGNFIICTTHQLYRYPHYFDLLILDELDAFPYNGNETLQGILQNSIKGNYIYMSATLDEENDVAISKRYHGYDLDIPKCYYGPKIMLTLMCIHFIKTYSKQGKPALLFVPTIKEGRQISKVLTLFHIKNHCISSKTSNNKEMLQDLKDHNVDVLVTTTILERGITLDNVQVIVLDGQHVVFNQATLIQICGRVGRKIAHPHGNILFLAKYPTKEIKGCISSLKLSNV